jgi:hypothetical protein
MDWRIVGEDLEAGMELGRCSGCRCTSDFAPEVGSSNSEGEPLELERSPGGKRGRENWHFSSRVVQVEQRGVLSSHFTRRFRHWSHPYRDFRWGRF